MPWELAEKRLDTSTVERDLEEFLAGGGAGDEDDVAWRYAKGAGEEFRDGGVGGALGGRRGHAEMEDALGVEALDGLAGGARCDANGDSRHPVSPGGGRTGAGIVAGC